MLARLLVGSGWSDSKDHADFSVWKVHFAHPKKVQNVVSVHAL